MNATYVIPAKISNTGSIHDLASDSHDREIKFGKDCKYAVVCAAYYGGKGYTTHKTESAACKASRKLGDYSHQVLDTDGKRYMVNCDELVAH